MPLSAKTPAGSQAQTLHLDMGRRVTQRELRNDSGRIMRAMDKGESLTVTRNGVPGGELISTAEVRFMVPCHTELRLESAGS